MSTIKAPHADGLQELMVFYARRFGDLLGEGRERRMEPDSVYNVQAPDGARIPLCDQCEETCPLHSGGRKRPAGVVHTCR